MALLVAPAGATSLYGTLDTSWASSGFSAIDSVPSFFGQPVAVAADGSEIAVGYDPSGAEDTAVVVKEKPDGTAPDPSFGTQGVVRLQVRAGLTVSPQDAAVDTSGRVTVVGRVGHPSTGTTDAFALRLNVDGTLDQSFNGSGILALDDAAHGTEWDRVVIAPDGKIVLLGGSQIWRLNADGSTDAGFASSGVTAPTSDVLTDIAVGGDGSIAALGNSGVTGVVIWHLKADGTFDASFGTGGKVHDTAGDGPGAVRFDSAGHIVAAMSLVSASSKLLLARYTASGARDQTFGTNGVSSVTIAELNAAEGLVIEPNGSLAASGIATSSSSGRDYIAVAGFDASGAPDPHFNAGGPQPGVLTIEDPLGGSVEPAGQYVGGGIGLAATGGVLDVLMRRTYVPFTARVQGTRLPPEVHTTGATQVTMDAATVSGTVDDHGYPTQYAVEYGPTTAYGNQTAPVATAAHDTVAPVSVPLTGLSRDTDYHARLVATSDGITVPGEDIVLHTAANSGAGLPDGAGQFSWSWNGQTIAAGAPLVAGNELDFSAVGTDEDTYQWDFDAATNPGRSTAGGQRPRHAFDDRIDFSSDPAQAVHGRRPYLVRLRVTAPNGASAEVQHLLTVAPDSAPKVAFTTTWPVASRRAGSRACPRCGPGQRLPYSGASQLDGKANAAQWVTFHGTAVDPDQERGGDDAIDHYEWHLTQPDDTITCRGANGDCVESLTGEPADPNWFQRLDPSTVRINFFRRALTMAKLCAPDDRNVSDSTPTTRNLSAAAEGWPACDALPAFDGPWVNASYFAKAPDPNVPEKFGLAPKRNPFISALYENATLLAQSSIEEPFGDAVAATRDAQGNLIGRPVTFTAYDAQGQSATIDHDVPLQPPAPPVLRIAYVEPDGHRISEAKKAVLQSTITSGDPITFDASGTVDPNGLPILYYTVETGFPAFDPCTLPPDRQFVATATPGQKLAAGGGANGGVKNLGRPGTRRAALRDAPQRPPLGEVVADAEKLVRHASDNQPDRGLIFARHGCPSPNRNDDQGYAGRNVSTPDQDAHPGADPASAPQVIVRPSATQQIVTHFHDVGGITRQSVSIGAYDAVGLAGVTRLDGFLVVPSGQPCVQVSGMQVHIGNGTYGIGGTCVTAQNSGGTVFLYADGGIDVNGVDITPDKTDSGDNGAIVLAIDAKTSDLEDAWVTTAPTPDPTQVDRVPIHPTAVTVTVDDAKLARYSGFSLQDLQNLVGGDVHDRSAPTGAANRGLVLSRIDSLTFRGDGSGHAQAKFTVVLPEGMSAAPGQQTTQQVTADVVDAPQTSELTIKQYAEVARVRNRRRAGAAQSVGATSSSLTLENVQIGPIFVHKGTVTTDPRSGDWSGEITDAQIQLGAQNPKVSFAIHILHGDLQDISGSVSEAKVPIIPGVVDLTGVRFAVVVKPLVVRGGASFAAAQGLVSGDLDMMLKFDPVEVQLTGSVRVLGLQVGDANVDVKEIRDLNGKSATAVTMGFDINEDFPGGSLTVGVDGGFSTAGDFYFRGKGRACVVVACLDVQALASNIALAACGSVFIGVDTFAGKAGVTISAGVAYRFHGGFEIYTGCDLDPYVPASFHSRVAGGTPSTITVRPGIPEVAIKAHADPAGRLAPSVTLTGPDGTVIHTPATQGAFSFGAPTAVGPGAPAGTTQNVGSLVDAEPADATTTFVIPKPAAGTWTVSVDPDSPPLTGVESASGRTFDPKALEAPVQSAAKVQALAANAAPRAVAARKHRPKRRRKLGRLVGAKLVNALPPAEDQRARGVVVAIPDALRGLTFVVSDNDAQGQQTIARIDTRKTTADAVPVVFYPSTVPGPHHIQAMVLDPDGMPRTQLDVATYTMPAIATPGSVGVRIVRRSHRHVALKVNGLDTLGRLPGSALNVAYQRSDGVRGTLALVPGFLKRAPGGGYFVDLGTARRRVGVRVRVSETYAGRTGPPTSVRRTL